MSEKLLSLLLAIALALSMVPTTAWAEAAATPAAATTVAEAPDAPAESAETQPDPAPDDSPKDVADGLQESAQSSQPEAPAAVAEPSEVAPFKKAGTYEIYSAVYYNGGVGSNNFKVGDTISVQATEKIEGSYDHPAIPTDKLSVTWFASSEKGGDYTPLEDENVHQASFVIPESLEGLYLKCTVNAGVNDYTRSATGRIAATDAFRLGHLELSGASASDTVAPGDTLTAKAFDSDGNDVTGKIATWAWYTATTASSNSSKTLIAGATGASFTVPADDPNFANVYLVAEAADGYGTKKSVTSGRVALPGSIDLYKVEAKGSPKVGQTLTASAYKLNQHNASVSVDSADMVKYQWQYASRNTTADSAFSNIPGATSATYTVESSLPDGTSLVGAYVRVKAVSSNGVVSTQKPYAGTTMPVDPLGPVTQSGVYALSSVQLDALTADGADGQGFQVGNVIVPQAMVSSGSYSEAPAPSDARLSYAWYAADSADGKGKKLEGGYDPADGRLKLTEDLKGAYLYVTVNALDNTVSSSDGKYGSGIANYLVVGSGEYELLRVTMSPSSGDVFTGATLYATVQARKLNGGTGVGTTGELISRFGGCTWYVGDRANGPFVPLEGATGLNLVVPPSAAGRYVKVVATSGASSVERVLESPIVGTDTLESAAQKLSSASFRPALAFGTSENVNELVEAELARLGYDGIEVTTKTAMTNVADEPNAQIGVSTAADATNGDVTFFYVDPDQRESKLDYSVLRQAKLSFVLTRGAESFDTEATYAPIIPVPWDEAKVTALLEKRCENLAIHMADGDSSSVITQDVSLPYALADGAGAVLPWSTVTWSSSNGDAIEVAEQGYFQDFRGKVKRSSEDQRVELTAAVGIITSGGPDTVVRKTFDVTVKGDPDGIDEATKALQQKVDAGYAYTNIKDSASHGAIDQDAVTGDLVLPNQGALGVGGGDYRVEYRSSTDLFKINGFAANAYRPVPSRSAVSADITVTVTDKRNEQIAVSKTLSFKVLPLVQADIERELALMSQAKAAYASALSNGQDIKAVTGNLHAFQKASLNDAGQLVWSYDRDSSKAAGEGIVPAELEGYDDMSSAGWRLFRSSSPSVVSHENLLVTRPVYDTNITIDARLSSEAYARYAERYPDNAAFQQLSNQEVSATFTVSGTSGQLDPHVAATCSVIGVDKDGNWQTWAAAQPYTLDRGATAADLSEAMFAASGLQANYGVGTWGWSLNSITSPFDSAWAPAWNSLPQKGWLLYINGTAAENGAGACTLQPGDSVVWYYGAWGDPAPTDQLSVTCEVVGVDAAGAAQTWASPAAITMGEGSTAADLSEALFSQKGLKADAGTGSYGWFLNSIASPYDGTVLGSVEASPGVWKYWQLFVNGELAKVGAGSHTLQAGDKVSWVYGSDGTMPGQVAATVQVLGMDANGNAQVWARASEYKMIEGDTAADLSEQAFAATGIEARYDPQGAYGWMLQSVTSPFDKAVELANESVAPYRYWQLFVNGKSSDLGAGSVVLRSGDSVTWCYSTYGSTLPSSDDVVVDPDAPRPSYGADWPGFSNGMSGGAVSVPTPTESTELSWSYDFREGSAFASTSDLLIVNGRLYLVVNGELRIVNATTGAVERRANVGASSAYFNRPVYADGVIIVPADNGSLAAFTADTLVCVWKTKPLDVADGESFQSLSSLTVAGGYVYAGFSVVGSGESTARGVFVCIDMRDGRVVWTKDEKAEAGSSMGYYWAGAAVSGSDIVIGDDAGRVRLLDGSTGEVLSSVDVGAPVRTGVIAVPSGNARAASLETFVVVTRDGTLHKIERSGEALEKVDSVSFSSKSTSTPAIAEGKVFVGAVDADGYGTLSVVDLATMAVERTVRGGLGEAQGSPLVSVQGDGVYAYFTCNGRPGGVYGYRLGDESAYLLYAPPTDQQQYGTSSIIADGEGNLYYSNDSGNLFALKGAQSVTVTFETGGGSYLAPYRAAVDKPLVRPGDPVRAGYVFGGWFADEECTRAWDFSSTVTGAMTLYAKWTQKGGTQGGSSDDPGATAPDGLPQSAAPSAKAPVQGGAAAATHAPLSQEVAKEGDAKVDKLADSVRPEARATLGTGAGSDEDSGEGTPARGVNPFAMGGVTLGVVGLIGATLYVVRMRRRNGEV